MVSTSTRYSLRPQKYQNIKNVVRCALFENMINYNSRTNRKSTPRTIRIPQKLDKLLERDAENKRGIINSLISSIITKYAEWDRYSELLQFCLHPSRHVQAFGWIIRWRKNKGKSILRWECSTPNSIFTPTLYSVIFPLPGSLNLHLEATVSFSAFIP